MDIKAGLKNILLFREKVVQKIKLITGFDNYSPQSCPG
jgi:hypothetical protein